MLPTAWALLVLLASADSSEVVTVEDLCSIASCGCADAGRVVDCVCQSSDQVSQRKVSGDLLSLTLATAT